MAYDPLRERAVFFSGEYNTGDYITTFHPIDTWEWDGLDWQPFVPIPEPAALWLLACVCVLQSVRSVRSVRSV